MAGVNSRFDQVSEAEILQIPDHQVAINPPAEVNRSPLEAISKAIHSRRSTNDQENIFVQENMYMASFLVAPSPTARLKVNFERAFWMFFHSRLLI